MKSRLSPVYGWLNSPSLIDFRGHLSLVLFTSGCNFRCRFCHNSELVKERSDRLSWEELDRLCSSFSENWVDAAVVTGGEPTLQEDLEELVSFLRARGFLVKMDTNGSNPDVLRRVLSGLDYVAMDIKCLPEDYPELAGFSGELEICQSLEILKGGTIAYELRTTIIESFHSPDYMKRLVPLVKGARLYVLQPFVPRPSVFDEALREEVRTRDQYLREIAEIFKGAAEEVRT